MSKQPKYATPTLNLIRIGDIYFKGQTTQIQEKEPQRVISTKAQESTFRDARDGAYIIQVGGRKGITELFFLKARGVTTIDLNRQEALDNLTAWRIAQSERNGAPQIVLSNRAALCLGAKAPELFIAS